MQPSWDAFFHPFAILVILWMCSCFQPQMRDSWWAEFLLKRLGLQCMPETSMAYTLWMLSALSINNFVLSIYCFFCSGPSPIHSFSRNYLFTQFTWKVQLASKQPPGTVKGPGPWKLWEVAKPFTTLPPKSPDVHGWGHPFFILGNWFSLL